MNRTEYVKAIATATGYTQKDVKAVLDSAQTIAYEVMAKEDEIKVFDGLTLVGVHKDATTARNPMTGAIVEVGEKTVPKAKFGKFAKNAVNA
jgi:nucleoid DNA-binding protein